MSLHFQTLSLAWVSDCPGFGIMLSSYPMVDRAHGNQQVGVQWRESSRDHPSKASPQTCLNRPTPGSASTAALQTLNEVVIHLREDFTCSSMWLTEIRKILSEVERGTSKKRLSAQSTAETSLISAFPLQNRAIGIGGSTCYSLDLKHLPRPTC